MIQGTTIDQVNEALEAYVRHSRQRGIDPEGFSSKTFRGYLNRVRAELGLDEVDYVGAGQLLQQYRKAQGDRRPNGQVPLYVIASQGYGPSTRWFILAKPDSDPKVVQEARRKQAEWAIADMTRRWASDVAREIAPALRGTELDALIADTVADVTGHLRVARQSLERSLRRTGTAKVSA